MWLFSEFWHSCIPLTSEEETELGNTITKSVPNPQSPPPNGSAAHQVSIIQELSHFSLKSHVQGIGQNPYLEEVCWLHVWLFSQSKPMSPSINDKQPQQQQLVSFLPFQLPQSWPLPGLPNPLPLTPPPRKVFKVLEKDKSINYTHPRIGWKRTLKGMLQPKVF